MRLISSSSEEASRAVASPGDTAAVPVRVKAVPIGIPFSFTPDKPNPSCEKSCKSALRSTARETDHRVDVGVVRAVAGHQQPAAALVIERRMFSSANRYPHRIKSGQAFAGTCANAAA